MRKVLSRESILGANDRPKEWVPTPEWAPEGASPDEVVGCGVYVRTLSGSERDAYDAGGFKKKRGGKFEATNENMRARLCALAICDEQGQPLFNERQALSLGMKSALVIGRIFKAAAKLNGLLLDDVEEMEGESDADRSGVSASS